MINVLVCCAIIQDDEPVVRRSASLPKIHLDGRKFCLKICVVMNVKLITNIVAKKCHLYARLNALQKS